MENHKNGTQTKWKLTTGLFIKLTIVLLVVFYFAVYLFMPFFVTGMDFGPTLSSQASLARYVWEPTVNRHIANWIITNHVRTFPAVGISRDLFLSSIVWPVLGLGLTALVLIARKTKATIVISALIGIWGLVGGILVAVDPVLAIGGLPYVLLIIALFATFVMAALSIVFCLRKGEDHDKK